MKIAFFGFALTFVAVVFVYPASHVAFGYKDSESVTDALKLAQTDESDTDSPKLEEPPIAPEQAEPPIAPRQAEPLPSTICYAEDLVGACSGTTECREFEQRPDGDLVPRTCVPKPFCEQFIAPCE
jgi:hypothetical protein